MACGLYFAGTAINGFWFCVGFARKPKFTGLRVGWRKILAPCMNRTQSFEVHKARKDRQTLNLIIRGALKRVLNSILNYSAY